MAITKDDIVLFPSSNDNNGNDSDLWTDYEDRRRMKMKDFQALNYKFYLENGKLRAVNKYGDFVANNIELSEDIKNYILNHPESLIDSKSLLNLRISSDKLRRPYNYEQGALPIAGPLEYAILGSKSLANGALKSTWNLVKPWTEKAVTDFSNKTNLSYWANNRTGKLGLVLYDSPFGVPTTSKAAVLGDAAIGAVGIDLAAKGLNASTDSKVNFGLSLLPMAGVATKGATNLYNAATQVPDYAARFAKTSKRIIKGFKDPKQWNPTFVGTASRKIFGYNPDKLINFRRSSRSYNGLYKMGFNDSYDIEKDTEQALFDASSKLNEIDRIHQQLNQTLKQIKLNEAKLITTSLQLRDTEHTLDKELNLQRKVDRLGFKYLNMPYSYQSYASVNPYYHRVFKPLDVRSLKSNKVLSLLYSNYPELFDYSHHYQNPFTGGKISFPIFKTGEMKEFDIPDINILSKFDPNIQKFSYFLNSPLAHSPKDYQEALRLNNEYIQLIIPGWKPFGSSVLALNGVPHATHDFDGAISWTDFQKWRDSLSPEDKPFLTEGKPGETYAFELNLKKFGDAGHIDINIINPKELNERSYELFRQFAPDDYEAANVSLASVSPKLIRRIPFVNKSGEQVTDTLLMSLLDPYTKSAMDAIESRKSKHLSRAPFVMLLGDPEKNAKALEQTAYELYGGHPYTIPESVDMGTPEDRLAALQEIGVPEWMANYAKNNPLITKNLINSYILTHKQLVRLSNAGDMHEDGGSKEKLLRNYLGYQPAPEGGSRSGRGTNWILGSDRAFDDRTFAGTMLPSEDLFKITEGTNIKDAVRNILKYFNMNNDHAFYDEGLFTNYLNTPLMIGNQSVKPLGFLGEFYNSDRYFGIGPLDNKKVNLRTFINRPKDFWGLSINDYNQIRRKNNRDNPDFVPGSFEGSLPEIEFPNKPYEFDQHGFKWMRENAYLSKGQQYVKSLRKALIEPALFKLRGNRTGNELNNYITILDNNKYRLMGNLILNLDQLKRSLDNWHYYLGLSKKIPLQSEEIQENLNLAKLGIQRLLNIERYKNKIYLHDLNLKRIKDTMLEYKPSSSWPLKMMGVLASPAIVGLDNWMENITLKRIEESYEFLNKNKIKYHVSPNSRYLIVYKNENPQITDWKEIDNWPNHILILNFNK